MFLFEFEAHYSLKRLQSIRNITKFCKIRYSFQTLHKKAQKWSKLQMSIIWSLDVHRDQIFAYGLILDTSIETQNMGCIKLLLV